MKLQCIFFIIFLIAINAYGEDVVKANCAEDPNETSELLKLFGLMKNSVLGTVPRFCREAGPEQLSDSGPSSKELHEFVNKLKASLKGVPDSLALDRDDETKKDAVILNTFRIVVLKKIWKNLDEEGQLKTLISHDCAKYGFNRTILSKNFKPSGEKSKNHDLKIKTMNSACRIKNFSDLAPFLSKDVLAEGLFNLKRIFPESFPGLVDELCDLLKITDEVILNDDVYAELGKDVKDVAEAENFSNWLKHLYLQVGNKYTENFPTDDLNDKKIKEINDLDPVAPGSAANLAAIYNAAQVSGATVKNPAHPSFSGFLVTKAADGKHILKLDPSQAHKLASNKDQLLQNLQYQHNFAQLNINSVKTNMESIFKEAQLAGNAPALVPYPGSKGFFIGKKDDGSLYLHLDDEAKLVNEKVMANYDKLMKEADIESSDYFQKLYKSIYEGQQKYGEDYYNPSLQLPYIKIVIKDGQYVPVPDEAEIAKAEINKKFYLTNVAPLFKDQENVSLPVGPNYLFMKNKKNEMVTLTVTEKILEEMKLTPEQLKLKKVQPLTLSKTLRSNYQQKTTDKNKLKVLTPEEKFAIMEYTGNGFGEMNTCLRKDSCSDLEKTTIKYVVSGIQKLKSEERKKNKDEYITLYRGSHLPDFVLENLNKEPKNFVLDKGFMSTSADAEIAKGFGSDVFIMKIKSCIGIAVVSSMPEEDEFLCPPGLKFNVKKQPGNGNVFLVEEVD